ncbi:hypothetical protein O6H91_Y289800 [Diphasiastrum complanatum]|nr:hypothetical protein O6H91_Y289800 [Diphasiastrum complanatum]
MILPVEVRQHVMKFFCDVKVALEQMLGGDVIMDVVDIEQARIADDAGRLQSSPWSACLQTLEHKAELFAWAVQV